MLSRIPPVTRALLIANIVVFVLQQPFALGRGFTDLLALWPLGNEAINRFDALGTFMPWQLLSYGFAHGDFMHLLFNMFALFMFGPPLEAVWGERRFATYYLVAIIGAGLCQLLVSALTGSPASVIGASGAVFALLLGYGMLFPNQRVMLMFPPIPMKARTFVIVFGIGALVLGLTGWQPGVAHFAHLGGMVTGWLLIRYWRGQGRRGGGSGSGPRQRREHLRVIK